MFKIKKTFILKSGRVFLDRVIIIHKMKLNEEYIIDQTDYHNLITFDFDREFIVQSL